jgi:hypothetical protein
MSSTSKMSVAPSGMVGGLHFEGCNTVEVLAPKGGNP